VSVDKTGEGGVNTGVDSSFKVFVVCEFALIVVRLNFHLVIGVGVGVGVEQEEEEEVCLFSTEEPKMGSKCFRLEDELNIHVPDVRFRGTDDCWLVISGESLLFGFILLQWGELRTIKWEVEGEGEDERQE
jgi:hypothetical protein